MNNWDIDAWKIMSDEEPELDLSFVMDKYQIRGWPQLRHSKYELCDICNDKARR